jgi:PAS domain S-box-containing protein
MTTTTKTATIASISASMSMTNDQRSITQRLAEAEATIAALLGGQIDAVLHGEAKTPLLLAAAQDALRESEQRYRRILETANEGILTIDAHSTITFVNQRVTDILGYSSAEMLGKSLLRFVSEAAAMLSALRTERSQRGISEEYEVSFLRSDGSELWALLKTSPITSSAKDGDKHAGTLVMLTDRTRDRRDEAELRTAEAHYRQMVEHAPDGIVKIDGVGCILFANARFADMLGCQTRELVGSSIQDHVRGEMQAAFAQLLAERKATDSIATTFLRKDRDDVNHVEVPVTVRSSTIVTGDGRYVATLAMIRDATPSPAPSTSTSTAG